MAPCTLLGNKAISDRERDEACRTISVALRDVSSLKRSPARIETKMATNTTQSMLQGRKQAVTVMKMKK